MISLFLLLFLLYDLSSFMRVGFGNTLPEQASELFYSSEFRIVMRVGVSWSFLTKEGV